MKLNFFKSRKRLFTSIRFKFIVVYVLVNIISLQLIGLYFTTQIKTKNINNFQTTIIEQEKKLNYNIMEELTTTLDKNQAESNIKKIVSEFTTSKLVMLNVVNSNLEIIASSTTSGNESYLGKRSVDPIVSQVLKTGESSSKEQSDDSQKIYWIYVSPIKDSDGVVVGATYIMADIDSVYSDMDDITRLFVIATILSIAVVTVIGLFASKTITNSIEKMSSQVKNMTDGSYDSVIGIDTKDEIGDLAEVFNTISKKIKDEQSSTELERRKLSTIINSMMDGIISTDSSGKILLINDSAKDMLSTSEENIFIGKDVLKILNITEYSSIAEILEAEDSLLVSLKEEEYEYLYRVEFTQVIRNDFEYNQFIPQKLDGYIIVLYDVTEKERQEQERREFVSTVSHELRTPLTTMNSYIEALEEGVLEDKKLAPVFIDTIHKETTRMIRMVNELMQLGKMDIKEEHYDKELLDINKLIETIAHRFKLTHPDKQFILHVPKEPTFVEVDQDKMTQVFDNILNNAVKYSPDGKNITIRVRQNYNQNRVSISIKDEGIGIPLNQIDKIFNRFYRVDKSRQRNMGGTGLGLSLAKSIVEAHKGKIWAQSREHYGTIIFVMLPSENITDEWI